MRSTLKLVHESLRAGRRRLATAIDEVIDIKDPRHPNHPANWDPTFPKAGPPLPQAWSEDPRNFGRVHPVLRGWVAVVAAGILWTTAVQFFATSVRTDPAEHWKTRQQNGESGKPTRPGAARPLDVRVDKATAAREVLREASGSSAAPAPAPVPTASLEAWLKSRGAELGCLTVTDASATPEATPWASGRGLGLSVGPSGRPLGSFGGGLFRSGDKILARIPLAGALTADNVLTKQPYGHVLQDAVTAGIADPRTVIMAALVVERLRGRTSAFAAYLSALPESFTTPLYLSPAELGNLQGTPLHEATASMRERLRAQWTKLRPFVSKALTAAGAGEEVATFDDFLWAFNVFWSRGHQLPTGEDALIPGLDFANHALDPNAWWQYAPGKKGESGSILILAPTVPDVGAEITVSYGDKSDEELLFMHGFALGRNPHNRLMVQMDPTALALREASLAARCELMALEGGVPFLQLPSPECVEPPFPARALRCAEILTLAPAELEAELAAARSGRPGVHRGPTEDAVKWAEFKRRPLAEQMALLSVLRGLLEQTVEAMEDAAKGTGALEHDVQLLQRGGLPARVLPCVLYRAGLKRMAREWLVRAKAELAEVIADLREETGAAAV